MHSTGTPHRAAPRRTCGENDGVHLAPQVRKVGAQVLAHAADVHLRRMGRRQRRGAARECGRGVYRRRSAGSTPLGRGSKQPRSPSPPLPPPPSSRPRPACCARWRWQPPARTAPRGVPAGQRCLSGGRWQEGVKGGGVGLLVSRRESSLFKWGKRKSSTPPSPPAHPPAPGTRCACSAERRPRPGSCRRGRRGRG